MPQNCDSTVTKLLYFCDSRVTNLLIERKKGGEEESSLVLLGLTAIEDKACKEQDNKVKLLQGKLLNRFSHFFYTLSVKVVHVKDKNAISI